MIGASPEENFQRLIRERVGDRIPPFSRVNDWALTFRDEVDRLRLTVLRYLISGDLVMSKNRLRAWKNLHLDGDPQMTLHEQIGEAMRTAFGDYWFTVDTYISLCRYQKIDTINVTMSDTELVADYTWVGLLHKLTYPPDTKIEGFVQIMPYFNRYCKRMESKSGPNPIGRVIIDCIFDRMGVKVPVIMENE